MLDEAQEFCLIYLKSVFCIVIYNKTRYDVIYGSRFGWLAELGRAKCAILTDRGKKF